MKKILLISLIVILAACHRETSTAEYTVDLTASLPVRSLRTDFDISRLGTFEGRFFVDTTMAFPRAFMGFDANSVLAMVGDELYRISVPEGKLLTRYGHKGRGPMEYLNLGNYRMMGGEVFVNDFEGGKLLVYGADGEPLRSSPTDRFVQLDPISPGRFLQFYPLGHKKGYLYDVVGEDGREYRASAIPLSEAKSPIIHLNGSMEMDGQLCTRESLSYDFYRITETEEICWIHGEVGKYEQPLEVLWNLELARMKVDQYIDRSDYNIRKVGDLAFVNYFMGGRHKVVYDLKSGKILFNIKLTSPDDPILGIPLKYEGKTWYIWPVYSDDNWLICEDILEENLWLFSR